MSRRRFPTFYNRRLHLRAYIILSLLNQPAIAGFFVCLA